MKPARRSVFTLAICVCLACSALGSGVAAFHSAAADALERSVDRAVFSARLADAAKTAVLLADPESRSLAMDTAASAGVEIFISTEGDVPGSNPDRSLHTAIENALFPASGIHDIRVETNTPDGSTRLLFGQALHEGNWIWARTELPPVDWGGAFRRAAVSFLLSTLLCGFIAVFAARAASRMSAGISSAVTRAANGEDPGCDPLPGEMAGIPAALSVVSSNTRRQALDRETALAGVAHDARTPLSRILLAAELADNPELEKTISQSVSEITSMLEEFAEFARAGTSFPDESFDPSDAISQAIRLSGCAQPPPPAGLLARGDRRLFGRGLLNIVKNHSVHGTGPVSIETSFDGRNLCIKIRDRGTSVSASDMEPLRAPFARGDASRGSNGSGLGLAIAERAAVSCGGSLSFHDNADGGFSSVVLVPASGIMKRR